MSLQTVVSQCDELVWRSSRGRREQIRALNRLASPGWSRSEIKNWRDLAEWGWGEGMRFLSAEFQWAYVPVPNFKTVQRTRKLASDRMTEAGFVARAVGFAMAATLAGMTDDEAQWAVAGFTDPGVFAATCQKLVDDGAARTAEGGPNIDDAGGDPVDALDMVWVNVRYAIQSETLESLDLVSRRSRYSPI